MKNYFRFIHLLIIMVLAGAGAFNASLTMAESSKPVFFDKNNMDLTISPGNDFFRYANGQWIKNFTLPDDRSSYVSFDQVQDQNRDLLHALCETLAAERKSAKPGTPAQKIGDFYALAMDTTSIEKLGAAPLNKDLKTISGIKNKQDLLDLIINFHGSGFSVLFQSGVLADLANSKITAFYFTQGGLGLGDRDYYTKEDADSQNIRKEYLIHIANMLKLLGDSPKKAESAAKIIMEIETRLAKSSKTNTEMRNIPSLYNKMNLDQLQTHCPEINWSKYLKTLTKKEIPEIIVTSPLFYKEVGLLFHQIPLSQWQIYLRWHLTSHYASFLSSPFVNEDFRFFSQIMSGTKTIQDRWKRMTNLTSSYLEELVGQMYVEKYFPPAAKQRMIELGANIKKAFEMRLKNVTWLSETAKQEALAKLAAMEIEVGYPDKWKDYSKLIIKSDSFVENIKRYGRFAQEKNIEKYGKPSDRTEWDMSPQIVNAGYNPLFNRMTFPAGILQPPFFFMDGDDAMNYGAIGMVIAHEMSHGFDDQGRHFDKEGNMREWWTKEDVEKFKTLTQILVEQYSNFTAIDNVKVNGELTLGENIADVSGLTIAYDAYRISLAGKEPQPIDGFSGGQRFFLAYAQLWRGKIRDEALKQKIQEDVHPWGEFRVNGAPFNIPAFYEVFDIKETDKLYRKPEQRTVIW